MQYDLLAIALAMIAALILLHQWGRRKVMRERGGIFDDCKALFESQEITQDDVNYPVLHGRYRGYDFKVEPIVDHVVVRKVPSLWLLVSILAPVPYRGVFDFLVRPQNTEFYSPLWSLPEDVDAPSGWPVHALARSNDPGAMPPLSILEPHGRLFDDVKMKELLVTPKGVRLVYQADQARRPHYMVLRQLIFEDAKQNLGILKHLMDSAITLYEDVSGTGIEKRKLSQ